MYANMKIAFGTWEYEFQFDADEQTISIQEKNINEKPIAIILSANEARSLHSFLTSIFNKGDV